MSWKRQTSSIQQPQHLSAPTLPPALGNLLTYLQVPSKPHVPASGTFPPQLPSPGLLSVFSNIPIHCSAPGSQLTSILSTTFPAASKLSYPEPHSPTNTGETETCELQLTETASPPASPAPTAHLRQILLPITLPPSPRLDLITGLFKSEKHLEM